ncbi:hypothetical protein DFR71_3612 [Nocardia alba]|uniref:Uncharacterized protein n=1 Tax=Nocardia alba TaxID=225051 RepID=A0A4R1FXN4_9NOCA|nr:hypothetical protein DFR71_3612 [Nocardia alba]
MHPGSGEASDRGKQPLRQPKDPALTSAITDALGAAGAILADRVRADLPHSPRPVFGFYDFDALGHALAAGGTGVFFAPFDYDEMVA